MWLGTWRPCPTLSSCIRGSQGWQTVKWQADATHMTVSSLVSKQTLGKFCTYHVNVCLIQLYLACRWLGSGAQSGVHTGLDTMFG